MNAVNDGYSGRASYWHEQLEIDRLKLFLRNEGGYVGICEIINTFAGLCSPVTLFANLKLIKNGIQESNKR